MLCVGKRSAYVSSGHAEVMAVLLSPCKYCLLALACLVVGTSCTQQLLLYGSQHFAVSFVPPCVL